MREKYGFDVEVVKKPETGLLKRLSLPKFPAVEVEGDVIAEGREVAADELEAAIRARM